MHEILSSYEYGLQEIYIYIYIYIYSAIFQLKHMKTGFPMITIRTVRAKLDKEALEKIKNTSKNDRRGYPPLLKFSQ